RCRFYTRKPTSDGSRTGSPGAFRSAGDQSTRSDCACNVRRGRERGPPNMGKILGVGATDILADILRLPAEERARLALELIRSLDGEPEAGAAQAWDAEIERRGAEVDRDAAETMTLDEYRTHIRK